MKCLSLFSGIGNTMGYKYREIPVPLKQDLTNLYIDEDDFISLCISCHRRYDNHPWFKEVIN